jgi:hypothetical protein
MNNMIPTYKVSRLGDADVSVYQYWRPVLLLVLVNIEHHRIKIFYVFTYLITYSNGLTVHFIPVTNLDDG